MQILAAFEKPVPKEMLPALTGWDEGVCGDILKSMEADGLINTDAQGRTVLRITPGKLHDSYERSLSDGVFGFVMEKLKGNNLKACAELHRFILKLMDRADETTAGFCYDHFLFILSSIPGDECDMDCSRIYIDLCIRAQSLTFYFLHAVEKAIEILRRAKETALKHGDARNTAIINLIIGSFVLRPSDEHNSPELYALIREGVQSIRSLGDADIRDRAAMYLGMYYYLEGNYRKALGFFIRARERSDTWETGNEMLTIYLTNCIAHIGEMPTAISLFRNAVQKADTLGYYMAVRALKVHLAGGLILNGMYREGLSYLEEAVSTVQEDSEPATWAWAQQTLAFYHFAVGDLETSHGIMFESMKRSVSRGYHRPIYLSPWLLELLDVYYKKGFSAIPSYEYIHERNETYTGPNTLRRIVARRLANCDRHLKGELSDEEFEKEMKLVLEKALQIDDKYQITQSYTILAQFYLGHGKIAEAFEMASHGQKMIQKYGLPRFVIWPDELDSLLGDNLPLPEFPSADSVIERLQKGMVISDDPDHSDDFNIQLLHSFCAELGVTRGIMCLVQNGKSVTTAKYNISEEEIQAIFNYDSLINSTLKGSPSLVFETKNSLPFAVCAFPFTDMVGNRLVVYFDGCMYRDIMKLLSVSFMESLAGMFEREYRRYQKINRSFSVLKDRERNIFVHADTAEDAGREILYRSPEMEKCFLRAELAADSDAAVLVLGESGVGKELFARYIHTYSGRKGAFVPVSLSSLPEELFESEMFGHEKGAFTGAHSQKKGLFELADNGTLFFDEIGDISHRVQVKLLRVLQERSFMRVGGARIIHSDFRLICATNRDLSADIISKHFREDLYYRISVIPFTLPPLRDRREDILLLSEYFLEHYAKNNKKPVPVLTRNDEEALVSYSWPGNIRELRNVMERAVILSENGSLNIGIKQQHNLNSGQEKSVDSGFDEMLTLSEMQKKYIEYVLEKTDWKIDGQGGAAEILGLKRSALYSRIKTYGLRKPN